MKAKPHILNEPPSTSGRAKNQFLISSVLIVGVLWMGLTVSLPAAVIFYNATYDRVTRFAPGTNEVGDEILLAGTERYLTNFSFEFWGTNTANPAAFAGPVEARVRFYQNNGTNFNGYPTPGTNFYDSGWFPIAPTSRSSEIFALGNDFPWPGLFLPATSNMTWSVQFQGMGATDSAGVDIYSPPVVGQDYPDYWLNTNGNWMLMTNNSGVHIDFGAVMEASAQPIVNPNPPWLTIVVSGTNLILSWPSDHIGWMLQVQTNSINVGISNNWHTIAGSSTVYSQTLPIDPANGCVFHRLVAPAQLNPPGGVNAITFVTTSRNPHMEIRTGVGAATNIVWHWGDGMITWGALVADHDFGSAEVRTNYVEVLPSGSVTYFGTPMGITGQGITGVFGLTNFPNLNFLYLYQESLTDLSLAGCANLRQLHLANNPVPVAVCDQWFIDLDNAVAGPVTGADFYYPGVSRSSASDAAWTSLAGKGFAMHAF